MKKIALIILMLALSMSLVVPSFLNSAQADSKSYYSGEAINYNSQVYIGTTNMGFFELFKVVNDKIVKVADIKPRGEFFDSLLDVEKGRLYVYMVDGKTVYKYDVSDPSNISLINKQTDNSKYWFGGIDKFADRLATVGNGQVKIWNKDLVVIDLFDSTNLQNPHQGSINPSKDGLYIYNVSENVLSVYDTYHRVKLYETAINADETNARRMTQNRNGDYYLVDDKNILKLDYSGKITARAEHGSDHSYDTAGVDNGYYIYYTTGQQVVKATNQTLVSSKILDRSGLPIKAQGWFMGLQVVTATEGEKVVVFNGQNIMLLDYDLKLLDFYTVKEVSTVETEALWLKSDSTVILPSSTINVTGGGFDKNEDVAIMLGEYKYTSKTNGEGRFSAKLKIPADVTSKTKGVDLKVTGKNSDLTYSLGLVIK